LASTWATQVIISLSSSLSRSIRLLLQDPPSLTQIFGRLIGPSPSVYARHPLGVCRNPLQWELGREFRNTLLKAAKHAIPSGFRRECVPGISREASVLIEQRDSLRVVDLTDPEIEVLNHSISEIISENKRSLWHEKVLSSGIRPDPTKCGTLLRNLSAKKTFVPPNQPICFNNVSLTGTHDISQKFIKQFVPLPKSDSLISKVL
jgi:hypothetical protein